jgi:hypothetical protein
MATSPATPDRPAAPPRPFAVTLLVGCLVVLSVTALWGGAALVAAPDGSLVAAVVDVDPSHLAGTPFVDYAVPGVLLAVAVGLPPLVASYALLRRRSWAWPASVATVALLLGWLFVELLVVGYVGLLQPVFLVFAFGLLALASAPAVREHCGDAHGA